MLIVMIALGTTDLIFALDSIPAIFGLTKEPYLVFTANVFALMGLRQLYFLLGGLLRPARLPVDRAGRRCSASSASSWCWRRCTTTTCRSSTAASRWRGSPDDPDLAVVGWSSWVRSAVTTVASLLHARRAATSGPKRRRPNQAADQTGRPRRPTPAVTTLARPAVTTWPDPPGPRSGRSETDPASADQRCSPTRRRSPPGRPDPGRRGVQHLPPTSVRRRRHEADMVDLAARRGEHVQVARLLRPERDSARSRRPGRGPPAAASPRTAATPGVRSRRRPPRRRTCRPGCRARLAGGRPTRAPRCCRSAARAARATSSSIAQAGSNRPGTATGSQPSCGAPSAINRVPNVTPGTASAASGSSRSAVAVATTTCQTPVRSSTGSSPGAGRRPAPGRVNSVQCGQLVGRHPARVPARGRTRWAG